jgi:hypothetical protein
MAKNQRRKQRFCVEVLEDRCCPAGPLLIFHNIQTDAKGYIVPWYDPDPGASYDHVLGLVWNYWKNLPNDDQYGLPLYYSYRALADDGSPSDLLGIGGDQFAMAIDSWLLYYAYTGDNSVLKNARDLADYYLAHSLAPANYAYANCPYPCNVSNTSDTLIFDGDLVAGVGVLQPDKAGSFGEQLVRLYQVTGDQSYLTAAVNIANTLVATRNTSPDANNSPWPFRVNASDGSQPVREGLTTSYTTNWAPTLSLFQQLIVSGQGDTTDYQTAFNDVLDWMLKYPTADNAWGPFGEDIAGYSDIQTNANTWAYYLLQNPSWDANWKTDVRGILDYVTDNFGDTNWNGIDWTTYGVTLIDEQTAYMVPGQSHTARDASVELWYDYLTGNTDNTPAAIRQLNWSTYMVAEGNDAATDGTNEYPDDGIWLTDGYGDYVRHYLRAMAADPALAPDSQNHLLGTSSVIQSIDYQPSHISYTTADTDAQDVLRVSFVPNQVMERGIALPKLNSITDLQTEEGYTFNAPGDATGVLRIHHSQSASVSIAGSVTGPAVRPRLTANAVTPSQINFARKDSSSGGALFAIDRSTGGGFTSNVVTQQSSTTSLADTNELVPRATYYYRVLAIPADGTSPYSSPASAQTLAGTPASGFVKQDSSSPQLAGAASYDGTQWIAQPSGVLLQEGTGGLAGNAFVFVTPANAIVFQLRTSTGADSEVAQVTDNTAPQWVELVRSGNTSSAFYSDDGVNFNAFGSPGTITFADSTYPAGMAVTGHNDDAVNTATFTNASVSSN